jgi:hypothetical protein
MIWFPVPGRILIVSELHGDNMNRFRYSNSKYEMEVYNPKRGIIFHILVQSKVGFHASSMQEQKG